MNDTDLQTSTPVSLDQRASTDAETSPRPSNGPTVKPDVPLVFAHHGKPLRGLMKTPRSPHFQGRFGRMFRSLPAATYGANDVESRAALMALGKAMTAEFDLPKDGFDAEESGIPALYTYFGQFIDHDITFDPMTTLIKHSDPDALTDFRTPALDLDNVYGRGPGDQPYMYDTAGKKFLLGAPLANGANDLPRNTATPARAIIGDPRNDENSIVSQFQGLMLRFHNRIVDDHENLDFAGVQRLVRWHYQWVVIHDFLPKLINKDVLDTIKTGDVYDQTKLKFYHWKNEPFMPVEFSVAAYRLGHSMIRPGYRMNDDDSTLLPIFPVPASVEGTPPEGLKKGLAGFQAMAADRGIDWGRFIDIDGPRAYGDDPDKVKSATTDMKNRLQLAYRIDTSVVLPVSHLPAPVAPDKPRSLADRNLIRAFELELPTGQDVARAMKVPILEDSEIVIGKAVDPSQVGKGDIFGTIDQVFDGAFKGKCPLWTYILAEAARNQTTIEIPVRPAGIKINTPQLGPVGGRIVAEVFLGMLFGDNDSFLSAEPDWVPTIRNGTAFALRDVVAYALGK